MANKHLDVPNFCSTLDDLLPAKRKRPRYADQFARYIADLAPGEETEPEMSEKAKAVRKTALKKVNLVRPH